MVDHSVGPWSGVLMRVIETRNRMEICRGRSVPVDVYVSRWMVALAPH